MRDMIIGQYYPGSSLIHRLDPRVKLLGTLLYLITVFMIHGPLSFAIVTAFLIAVTAVSHVPVKLMLKSLRGIMVILILTFIFSLFLTQGEVLVKMGPLHITKEGLSSGLYMLMRLSWLVIGASLMTLTTTPGRLTQGLESGLGFLTKFHVPVHETAMMMSIALRFIPILIEEETRIIQAQQSRGADFHTGNALQRVKKLTPILVPMFVSTIRRADELALAMDARCYRGGESRTSLHPLSFSRLDRQAWILLGIYTAAVVICFIFRV